MPIARIITRFGAQISKLAQQARTLADANLLSGVRRIWQRPDPSTHDGNPFSLGASGTGIGSAYDRTDANQDYEKAVQTAAQTGGGRLADRMVSKLQVDHLASQERAYRARHASAIRCAYLAASRRLGHGDAASGVFGATQRYLNDLLAAGYREPEPPRG